MSETSNLSKAVEILERQREASPQETYGLVEELKKEKQFRLARRLREMADVKRGRNILRGENAGEEEKYKLAMSLKDANQFGLARKLLSRVTPPLIVDEEIVTPLKVGQQRALCTYKDPDLSADVRLTRAFEILKNIDDPKTSTDPETLGLAGAIYKRMWEYDAQNRHLERALSYYTKGYKAKKPGEKDYDDYSYTGINAAFVQDLLANQEEAEARAAGTDSESAKARRAEAAKIRGELVAILPTLKDQPGKAWLARKWWYYVTIAEAYFGLGEYDAARPWLTAATALEDIAEWQRGSTTRQLAYLAQLHGSRDGTPVPLEAQQVLRDFLGSIGGWSEAAIQSAFYGKIGLALSGGGFRASLFHIGVLARLAELDLLRHVEVLSCVSGGSIVGAHYYLEMLLLLSQRTDGQITHQDYVNIMKRIEKQFLAGVQSNIRMQVSAEWRTNLKMVFCPNYSRTKRAGELYERELYERVEDDNGSQARFLSSLTIQPADGPENFRPKYDNWRRAAKVPDLILNATTLNTGHTWQFTATWMGEPPAAMNSEIDANYRLRRLYYHDAPNTYRGKHSIRLGDAVGASACVPGLFEPIALTQLYGERGEQPRDIKEVVVRLVDGGVHDNQGIAGLLEQGCSQIIVSDASGQMDTLDDPSSGLLSVPLRSNGILMSRVREAQHQELVARRRALLLQGLIFVHLKKDLNSDPLDWLECNDRWNASDEARPPERAGDLTSYGVRKEVQRLLASVRTDLDSFSEAEAYALMMSGYAMIERVPAEELRAFPTSAPLNGKFCFLKFREPMSGEAGYPELVRLLKVSHLRGFKIWKLSKWLRVTGWILSGLILFGLFLLCWWLWTKPQFQFTLGIALALLLAVIVGTMLLGIIGPPIQRFLHWRKTPSEFGIGLAMATLGFIAARVHLLFFDWLFLKHGRAERVVGNKRPCS